MGLVPPPALRGVRPVPQRVYAFIDGMNLFNSAKRCFGNREPNCDYARLVNEVVNMEPGRQLEHATLYVGIPKSEHDAQKNRWWTRKLAATGRTGIQVVTRYLKKRATGWGVCPSRAGQLCGPSSPHKTPEANCGLGPKSLHCRRFPPRPAGGGFMLA